MSTQTKIEWATGTFNPWEGCTKVSPGCAHCYAEARNHRFGNDNWGKGKPRRRTSEANWKKPAKWNALGVCALCGELVNREHRHGSIIPTLDRPRIFPSLCDWLDEEVPIEWLANFLNLIADTPNLDWLLLTKRPELCVDRVNQATRCHNYKADGRLWNLAGCVPHNVWIGTSVEDQQRADERIPALLKIPAKVRFLSVEPLLSEVNLMRPLLDFKYKFCEGAGVWEMQDRVSSMPWLDWVIIGGESGPNSRPCNIEWIRSIVAQCKDAGVPCFVKQLGQNATVRNDSGDGCWPGYTIPIRDDYEPTHQGEMAPLQFLHPKGGDPSEWPQDLRVRQFPNI